jgi:hypothetical protein
MPPDTPTKALYNDSNIKTKRSNFNETREVSPVLSVIGRQV